MENKNQSNFKKEYILFFLLLLLHNISSLNEISLVIDKRKGTDIIRKNFFSLVSEVIVNGKSKKLKIILLY